MRPITPGRRLLDAAAMALVAGLSFLLLVYVGYGEAQRSYERFYLDKLTAQNRMLQGAIEGFLRRDLPLRQYVGFRARAERVLASDSSVDAMVIYDQAGAQVFASGDETIGLLRAAPAARSETEPDVQVRRSDRHVQVVLPLANRFERVGSIAVTMQRAKIDAAVVEKFRPLVPAAVILALLFAAFADLGRGWIARQRPPWLQLVYTALFLATAGGVIATLVGLYTRGAQLEVKALADSLGQRMTEIVGFQLDLQQVQGLDRAFSEYRRLNPDIGAVVLNVDGRIAIHTDSYMVGKTWSSSASDYEYVVDITPAGSSRRMSIAVTLPEEVVYRKIIRSAKNFAALFIASAFLANAFLQLAGSFRNGDRPDRPAPADAGLRLVKPMFYVAMCVEHLIYAFLPQHIQMRLSAAGMSTDLSSIVVTAYYLCFALTLIPAGHVAQRLGTRLLMSGGLGLTSLGLLTLMLPDGFLALVLGRALAGVGQAMLLIGVQSYILSASLPERKTQGAAIIVFGFQGGMIAGMAIGSLLVIYVGADGVFLLGAVTAALLALYARTIVPDSRSRQSSANDLGENVAQAARNLTRILQNRDLLETIGLIGLPAKAVLTGVVVFALPLLMAAKGYRQEDIGQMLMIYAGAVVVASSFVARLVDRSGGSGLVLATGAVTTGAGLALVALVDLPGFGSGSYSTALQTGLLAAGILVIGAAHGLINAPIVTHVANLDVAERIGASATTAGYRFLERLGHVLGPVIVAQLTALAGGRTATAIAWIAVAVALGGLAFVWRLYRCSTEETGVVAGLYLDHRTAHMALALAERSRGSRPGGRTPGPATGTAEPGGAGDGTAPGIRDLQDFLVGLSATTPSGVRLRVIGVGSSAEALRAGLGAGRVEVETVATAAAWLERIGTRLAAASRHGPDGDRAVRQLTDAINRYLAGGSPPTAPFVWMPRSSRRAALLSGRGNLVPAPA